MKYGELQPGDIAVIWNCPALVIASVPQEGINKIMFMNIGHAVPGELFETYYRSDEATITEWSVSREGVQIWDKHDAFK